jgi:hypothetical protein
VLVLLQWMFPLEPSLAAEAVVVEQLLPLDLLVSFWSVGTVAVHRWSWMLELAMLELAMLELLPLLRLLHQLCWCGSSANFGDVGPFWQRWSFLAMKNSCALVRLCFGQSCLRCWSFFAALSFSLPPLSLYVQVGILPLRYGIFSS